MGGAWSEVGHSSRLEMATWKEQPYQTSVNRKHCRYIIPIVCSLGPAQAVPTAALIRATTYTPQIHTSHSHTKQTTEKIIYTHSRARNKGWGATVKEAETERKGRDGEDKDKEKNGNLEA